MTLEVAKQGALLHGLATLLHQPAYNQKQGTVITIVLYVLIHFQIKDQHYLKSIFNYA